jgi:large subunit ribosomal protein L33
LARTCIVGLSRREAARRTADDQPTVLFVMREYVWLECTVCNARNYRTNKETRGAERLELKKFCRKERKHTPHKESRKK